MMRERLPTRSDKYQYVICEISMDLSLHSQSFDLESRLHSNAISDNFACYNDQIYQRIIDIAFTSLTPRQREVLKMFMEGKTQIEIAKTLNVNQSSIAKCLNGNTEYGKCYGGKTYGGLGKKLRKFILQDSMIRKILGDMRYCDDLIWKHKHPKPIIHYKYDKHTNINLYYLISTMFKNDTDYQRWIDGATAVLPDRL